MQRIYLYGTKEGHLECKDCALNYDCNNLFSQGKNCVANYRDRSGRKIIHGNYIPIVPYNKKKNKNNQIKT